MPLFYTFISLSPCLFVPIIGSLIFFVVAQGEVATTSFNTFVNGVADSSVQHLLRTLFSQVPLVDVKRFESYSNHFVRGIPSRSGRFNMVHSKIEHQSKEVTEALCDADKVDDPDDLPVVVLLGVSGAGKTRTAYDIAKQRYTVYFEATTIHSNDLTAATKEMEKMEQSIPPPKDIPQIAKSRDTFETHCEHITHRLILARVLTLLLLHGSGKVTSPEDWLLVQLNGGGTIPVDVFNRLKDVIPGDKLLDILGSTLKIFKNVFGDKLTVITDEAHLLISKLLGAFRRPNHLRHSPGEIYSPNQGIKGSQSRPLLSFWLTSLRALPILPIVCGTALRLRHLELIRSAAGRSDRLPRVVKDFPYLDQGKVEVILHFHLDLTGIPDEQVKRLANELTGVFVIYIFLYMFCYYLPFSLRAPENTL